MKRTVLCITFLFLAVTRASAGELDEPYWKWFVTDTARTATAPVRWEANEWGYASATLLITGGLYAYDPEVRHWVQDNRTSDGGRATDVIEPMGNGKYLVPALGAYYLYGYYAGENRVSRTAMLGFESYVVSGLVVNALKFGTHRHRPNSGDPHNTWDGPSARNDDLSFPSGHASSAFAVAAVVASEYRENRAVTIASYGLATLVSLSRIYDDKHWASDAFLGSAIGCATGLAIYEWRAGEFDRTAGISLFPLFTDETTGVMLTYRF